ncbi:MAG: hypothetical protein IJX43_01735 [Alphaproteobacteria bacterium]|nr:hypothetical protein [Alphaproteobacteria bacterium]
MALNTNQHYFDISINSPEPLDLRYAHLNWDADIDAYVETTQKIKELLATIKTLKDMHKDADDIYVALYRLLMTDLASKSELNCFINACDCTTGVLKQECNITNLNLFKYVVDLYLLHRDFTDLTPKEWIQALIDKGSSRADGKIGECKLVDIATAQGFVFVEDWAGFMAEPLAVTVFKKGVFDISNIKEKLGVNLQFNAQNKMLDLILKKDDMYVFLEAKHMKECGGSQDKQMKELIDIIKTDTGSNKIKYVAFLDGFYSNLLLRNIKNPAAKNAKTPNQQRDINEALARNQNSYWLNTAGFKQFVHDLAL